MREQEMRLRVFQFLKARMRNMLMPATLGIGLAVGGCAEEGVSNPYSDAAADVAPEASPVYSAPVQDSSIPGTPDSRGSDLATNLPETQAKPDTILPGDGPIHSSDASTRDLGKADAADVSVPDVASSPDQAVALDGGGIDGGKPADAGPDLGVIITKYIAPIPDAGRDAGVAPGPDAATDAGGIAPVYIAPLYIAQMPDAAADDGRMGLRYLAQMPDGSAITPLYIAPLPS